MLVSVIANFAVLHYAKPTCAILVIYFEIIIIPGLVGEYPVRGRERKIAVWLIVRNSLKLDHREVREFCSQVKDIKKDGWS